jgi:hypothetical protein
MQLFSLDAKYNVFKKNSPENMKKTSLKVAHNWPHFSTGPAAQTCFRQKQPKNRNPEPEKALDAELGI